MTARGKDSSGPVAPRKGSAGPAALRKGSTGPLRKLSAGAGPSPARPDRYKKGSYLRLDPSKWAELAAKLTPEQRVTYWSLLALAPRGEFAERSATKLAHAAGVKPTRARELIDELSSIEFGGGPVCFVEERAGVLTVRLAINNGLLVLHSTSAPVTPTTAAPSGSTRVAPPRDFVSLIAAARGAFCDLAGEGGCELGDALLAAMAEREEDGQLPGSRQVAFYRELAELHAIGGGHVAAGLHEMLRRPELPADNPLSYLRAIVVRLVSESGRGNGSSHRIVDAPTLAAPDEPGAQTPQETVPDEPGVRRTPDGRRIADDFNPDEMF